MRSVPEHEHPAPSLTPSSLHRTQVASWVEFRPTRSISDRQPLFRSPDHQLLRRHRDFRWDLDGQRAHADEAVRILRSAAGMTADVVDENGEPVRGARPKFSSRRSNRATDGAHNLRHRSAYNPWIDDAYGDGCGISNERATDAQILH